MIRGALIALVTAVNLFTTSAFAQEEARTFDAFSDLRATVLESISAASKRVWLVTDYLTDGEIVSALYLAQYRKIDVQVLLGRGKANHYMSRLNYLKNQNIPVFLRPESFKPGFPTGLLVDDRLVLMDSDLDFLTKSRRFRLEAAAKEKSDSFASQFENAVRQRVPAVPHQVPLVGKATGKGRIYSPDVGSNESAPVTVRPAAAPAPTPRPPSWRAPAKDDGTGAYVYDRRPMPRPDGVPTKLPKNLKWTTNEGTGKTPPDVPRSNGANAPLGTKPSEAPSLPQDGG